MLFKRGIITVISVLVRILSLVTLVLLWSAELGDAGQRWDKFQAQLIYI